MPNSCLLLLSPGRSITRARAARALFPEADERASNSLAKAIHWCRQALGEPWDEPLTSQGGWLRWEGPVWTDADAALRAARPPPQEEDLLTLRAVASQSGELLPGWDEEWVDQVRQEVSVGRRLARSGLARVLEHGDPDALDEAIGLWQALVDEDPLDQDGQLGLLRTLFRAQRADAAGAAWRQCRQVLWAELGALPGPELEAVWHAHGVPEGPRPRRPAASIAQSAAPHPADAPLVGRSRELAALTTRVARAEHMAGESVTLLGAAGAGKSSLLRAMTDHFRREGWQVVEAAGTAGIGRPFGTARTLLQGLLSWSDGQELDRLTGAGPGPLPPPTRQVRVEATVHRAVAAFLDRAACIPTLLVVDDLHDVDPASLRLLQALAHIGGRRAWSLVAASRYVAASLRGGELVTVDALDAEALRAVICSRFPASPRREVDIAVARSEGNPLFALEIAALLRMRGDPRVVPPTAIELLRDRLRRLPPAERLLMPLVAVAAKDATWQILTEAARCLWTDPTGREAEMRHAADVLMADDLLRERGPLLEPSHPLIGEAATTLLSRTTKARLHDAIGEALALIHPSSEALALHRMAAFELLPDAGHASSAVNAALDAARSALSLGRDQDAADMARRVERAWTAADPGTRAELAADRSEALLILGHALASGSPEESGAAYRLGWGSAPNDETRALFLVAEGWMRYQHGDFTGAAQVYRSGLAPPGARASTHASLCTHLGWVLARQGLLERGLQLCDEALALLEADPDPIVHGTALDRRVMILAFLGDTDEARLTVDQAFEVATAAGDRALLCAIQSHRGSIRGRLGQWEHALRCLDEAVALARSLGDPYLESIAWWERTDVLTRKGDLDAALAANLEEDRALRLTGNEVHRAACGRRRRRLTGEDEPEPVHADGPTP